MFLFNNLGGKYNVKMEKSYFFQTRTRNDMEYFEGRTLASCWLELVAMGFGLWGCAEVAQLFVNLNLG